MTAKAFSTPAALREVREQVEREHPELRHDLSALRCTSIAWALRQAGEDAVLAITAFEIFFAERQRVQLYDDALPALEFLAARWPVVAITNGNADVHRMGLGHFFHDYFNVQRCGVAKPDRRIFDAAVQALGVPAHTVLHIGDDWRLDAQAAQDAGLQAVWLNRAGTPWPGEAQSAPAQVQSLQTLCAWLSAGIMPASMQPRG